jgi:hypothetical protein
MHYTIKLVAAGEEVSVYFSQTYTDLNAVTAARLPLL